MSKKFPWLSLQKKNAPEAPLEPPVWMGNRSNGEFWHDATPKERLMRKEILSRAETEARKRGIDRREFLASAAGMITTMTVINQLAGCKDDGTPGNTVDGGNGQPVRIDKDAAYYVEPVEADCDAEAALAGDEFIFDIQTHSFDDGEWRTKNPSYAAFLPALVPAGCTEADKLDCFSQEFYADLMFVQSDTTMSVISSWPANTCTEKRNNSCGLPLSNEGMRELRDWLNDKAQSQRVVNQVQIMPNDEIELQKDIMSMAIADKDWRAVSWKAYPAWKSDNYRPNGIKSGEGYFLTDDIGLEFIEHGLSLGVPNSATHKGLPIPGFDLEHNKPTDVGPVAKMYPQANFVIYHSAINAGCGAGCGTANEAKPFDPNDENPLGMSMLLKSLLDAGLITEDGPKKGLNVYPELGSAWSNVMRDTVAAQHFIGKLLKYVGPDNICWGTDSILGGSPQNQIEMFRKFEISESFQEMFGYPALTKEIKAKIFGLNSARIYKVDPTAMRCTVEKSSLAARKQQLEGELGGRRWTQMQPLAPRTKREFIEAARIAIKKGHPGIV